MDTVIQDIVLGAGSMPPHIWMTAAGGLTLTLLIFLLRPRKKVVQVSKTSDVDTGTPISEQSNHVDSSFKCEKHESAGTLSSDPILGVKGKSNETSDKADLTKTLESEIVIKAKQESYVSAMPQLDDDEDIDASLKIIEDQLLSCQERIQHLEKELKNEQAGRQAAQDWTTLLEKELEAHISARKATENRCSRLANCLREARRTLKHTQRRCAQLEKLIAEHAISPAITITHHDSSFVESLMINAHENEVEMDSLEDSDSGGDAPYNNHRKDSLEDMVQGNITMSSASRKSSRHHRITRNSEFRRDSLEPEMYEHNLDASPPNRSFHEEDDNLEGEVKLIRHDLNQSQEINQKVVLPGDFSSEEEEEEEEYLDEDEEELYGIDSDPGLPTSGRIEDFELSRDVMDVIISNVQGDLPDMLDQDGDNDSLSDLLQDNLAAMDGEEVEELRRQGATAEVSAESIGDTKRTKKFWEEIIASDHPGQGAGTRRGSHEANGLDTGRRTHFQAVKGHWERSYTPDSLHGSEEAGGLSGNDGSDGSGARFKRVLPMDHSSDFASIRQQWDTVNQRKSSRNSSDSEGGHQGGLGSRIESMKQHWEKAMSESPSPRSGSTRSDSLERATDFSELKHHWDSFNHSESSGHEGGGEEEMETNNNIKAHKFANFKELKSQWQNKVVDLEPRRVSSRDDHVSDDFEGKQDIIINEEDQIGMKEDNDDKGKEEIEEEEDPFEAHLQEDYEMEPNLEKEIESNEDQLENPVNDDNDYDNGDAEAEVQEEIDSDLASSKGENDEPVQEKNLESDEDFFDKSLKLNDLDQDNEMTKELDLSEMVSEAKDRIETDSESGEEAS